MNFNFKKLTSKTLSIISILKVLHKEKKVLIQRNSADFSDYLELSKQNLKIRGLLSVLSFFEKKGIDSNNFDLQWWLLYNFKQIGGTTSNNNAQKKAFIPEQHLGRIEQLLQENQFLSGNKLGDLDIIAYVKINRFQQDLPDSLKNFEKLSQWYQVLDQQIAPLIQVDAIEKELQNNILEAQKQQEQKNKKDAKKQDKKKENNSKEDKKQLKKQAAATEQKAPPKQAAKKKGKEVVDPEYLKAFANQKIQRLQRPVNPTTYADKKNTLITSALPYCNNAPHLGTLIGCVLSADVYARYSRLRGHNSIYVCGTDEYGTATEMRARKEGLTPNEICTKYWKVHNDVYSWFDIDFDIFGRTSTPKHTEITQEIFKDLKKNDLITEHSNEQYYCDTECKTFLADRYVKGECPHCQYADAKGDQCDGCGKLMDKLNNPKCAHCNNPPVIKETNHMFIKLPEIQPKLEKWIDQQSVDGYWSQNSINVSKAWMKTGLQDRCITRDLKWGTPVPLKGWENKVFYVWFDAPIGYISITANLTENWQKWWKNPEHKVENVQFMAKDNIPFHTVIFPCTLLGQSDKWTKIHHISSCEYLNYEDKKFSKTNGTGVFGDDAEKTGIPAEVWRYYLLINRPETKDSVFSWKEFQLKNNSELLANPGNFANRGLKFCYSNYNKQTPSFNPSKLQQEDKDFLSQIWAMFQEYVALLDKVNIRQGLQKVMEISSRGNLYLQENEPWVKANQESGRSETILFVYINALRFLSLLFEPFLPSLSAKINFLLGQDKRTSEDEILIDVLFNKKDGVQALLSLVKPNQPINQPLPLFSRLEDDDIDKWIATFGGQQQ